MLLKTYKHLYEQVYDFENLYLAYRKERKGKRMHEGVTALEHTQQDTLLALQDELR